MKCFLFSYLFVLLMSVSSSADTFQFDYEKKINIGEHPQLMLNNKIGSVEIKGEPIPDIEVTAVKNIKAADQYEAEKMAEYIEIKVTKSGDHLSIETIYHENSNDSQSFWDRLLGRGKDIWGSVEFKISVPYNCEVNVDAPKGDVKISDIENEINALNSDGKMTFTNIKGPIYMETISARIDLSGIVGDINMISSGSDIDFQSVTGRIEIKSTSGKIKGNQIDGPVDITSTSGSVDISQLTGDIKIQGTSGTIKIAQEMGGIDIATHNGDVDISSSLESDRGYFVSTGKGNIVFNVPELASGSVKLETESGGINTELPLTIRSFEKNKLVGDFGTSGPKITLTTVSGDIKLGLY